MTGVAYGWILFHRLVSHMFRPVPPSKLNEFNMNSVPNRHASLHGLVQYSTYKHSMNMIIMTDYVFQLFTCIRNSYVSSLK